MLDAARTSGDVIPELLLCNVDWTKDSAYTKNIKRAFDDYGAKAYDVFVKNGVRIAIFGLFGKDSFFCAPTCQLTFLDQYEQAAKTVKLILKSRFSTEILM